MVPRIKGRYHVELDPKSGFIIQRYRCFQCEHVSLLGFDGDIKEAENIVKEYLDQHLMHDCPAKLEGDWLDWPMYEWNEVITNV